jgi:hypothetical protein
MKARKTRAREFKLGLFALLAGVLTAFLVAAPAAGAAAPAAAFDQYQPQPPAPAPAPPPSGGGTKQNCSNKTYFQQHKRMCLRKKCKKRSYFKHHKKKCRRLLHKRTVPGTTASNFIGYPVTSLIWTMFGLVGLCLALRLGWVAWWRRRGLSG